MGKSSRIALLFIGDIIMLVIAFFIMLSSAFPGRINAEIWDTHFLPFSILGMLWITIFFIFNLYNPSLIKPTISNLRHISLAFIVSISVSFIFFYLIPFFNITPKTNLTIWGVTFIILFILWRRIFYSIFSSLFKKSVAIIMEQDNNGYLSEVIHYMNTYPQSGFLLTGVYSSIQDFFGRNKSDKIDSIIISKQAIIGREEFKDLYKITDSITDFSYTYENILGKIPVSTLDNDWLLHNLYSNDNDIPDLLYKSVNKIIALLILILLTPIIIIISVAIKIFDRGPVLYIQDRVGLDGKVFKLYKFRSMKIDADRNGAEWTDKNDKRITRIGNIIRKIHVDEIPQLWNIFKGDMLIVGPRPEIPSFVEKLETEIPYYSLRHIITPGFTGWAQIKFKNARGIAETKEKFEYDLYYIKNKNIFMDIGILIRTIAIIFTHD